MGKIDLSKDISLKDLKNISLKKKAGKQKKMVVSTKKGINLVRVEKKKTNPLLIVGVALAAVAIIALVAIYGFINPINSLNSARSELDDANIAYLQAQQLASEYDATLEQYRAYSMDWYNNDTTGRYVSVSREEILNMIDTKVYPKGTLTGVSVIDNMVTLAMKDMTLPEVTAMITEIEQEDYVTSCFLKEATSQEETIITKDEKGNEVVTTVPGSVIFTVTINLTSERETVG